MREGQASSNRIDCLIEKQELNYLLVSCECPNGEKYRGVLINERCSIAKRLLPKANLDDEIIIVEPEAEHSRDRLLRNKRTYGPRYNFTRVLRSAPSDHRGVKLKTCRNLRARKSHENLETSRNEENKKTCTRVKVNQKPITLRGACSAGLNGNTTKTQVKSEKVTARDSVDRKSQMYNGNGEGSRSSSSEKSRVNSESDDSTASNSVEIKQSKNFKVLKTSSIENSCVSGDHLVPRTLRSKTSPVHNDKRITRRILRSVKTNPHDDKRVRSKILRGKKSSVCENKLVRSKHFSSKGSLINEGQNKLTKSTGTWGKEGQRGNDSLVTWSALENENSHILNGKPTPLKFADENHRHAKHVTKEGNEKNDNPDKSSSAKDMFTLSSVKTVTPEVRDDNLEMSRAHLQSDALFTPRLSRDRTSNLDSTVHNLSSAHNRLNVEYSKDKHNGENNCSKQHEGNVGKEEAIERLHQEKKGRNELDNHGAGDKRCIPSSTKRVTRSTGNITRPLANGIDEEEDYSDTDNCSEGESTSIEDTTDRNTIVIGTSSEDESKSIASIEDTTDRNTIVIETSSEDESKSTASIKLGKVAPQIEKSCALGSKSIDHIALGLRKILRSKNEGDTRSSNNKCVENKSRRSNKYGVVPVTRISKRSQLRRRENRFGGTHRIKGHKPKGKKEPNDNAGKSFNAYTTKGKSSPSISSHVVEDDEFVEYDTSEEIEEVDSDGVDFHVSRDDVSKAASKEIKSKDDNIRPAIRRSSRKRKLSRKLSSDNEHGRVCKKHNKSFCRPSCSSFSSSKDGENDTSFNDDTSFRSEDIPCETAALVEHGTRRSTRLLLNAKRAKGAKNTKSAKTYSYVISSGLVALVKDGGGKNHGLNKKGKACNLHSCKSKVLSAHAPKRHSSVSKSNSVVEHENASSDAIKTNLCDQMAKKYSSVPKSNIESENESSDASDSSDDQEAKPETNKAKAGVNTSVTSKCIKTHPSDRCERNTKTFSILLRDEAKTSDLDASETNTASRSELEDSREDDFLIKGDLGFSKRGTKNSMRAPFNIRVDDLTRAEGGQRKWFLGRLAAMNLGTYWLEENRDLICLRYERRRKRGLLLAASNVPEKEILSKSVNKKNSLPASNREKISTGKGGEQSSIPLTVTKRQLRNRVEETLLDVSQSEISTKGGSSKVAGRDSDTMIRKCSVKNNKVALANAGKDDLLSKKNNISTSCLERLFATKSDTYRKLPNMSEMLLKHGRRRRRSKRTFCKPRKISILN